MAQTQRFGDAKQGGGGVAAVERALSILDAFRGSDGRLTLAELAERTGLYKSTILRLIISLEAFGYIRRLDAGDYQLGPRLSEMALIYQSSFRLETFVLPVLREVVKVTRESASFFIREREARICLFRVDSPQAVRDHVQVGDILPLDKGAGGRTLLRFEGGVSAARRAAPEDFVIVSHGERAADTAAVAAPVFGANGDLLGALVVSGPLVRFDPEALTRISPAVLDAAVSLSLTLGSPAEIFPNLAADGQ